MLKKDKIKYGQTIYYENELTDDFETTNLKREEVPENYKFARTNKFYNFWSNIFYFGVAVPILKFVCLCYGIKVVGKHKESFKEFKKNGGYIYSNHTSFLDMFDIQTAVCGSKRTNIIGYTDVLSFPVVKHIVRALGFIPLPDNPRTFRKFSKALEDYQNKKELIIIYPEAHVWPYYTGIRPFVPASFKYPAKLNAPCLPITACYRKSKISKHAKITLYIGEPIYPKKELSVNENKDYLREECYNQMVETAKKYSTYKYVNYVKKEKEEEENGK